jgi:hypothetical protein
MSGPTGNATAAAATNAINELAPAVTALIARQMGLNLSNNAAMNSLAGALTGNMPLGNTGSAMGMSSTGLNSMPSSLGAMGSLGGSMNLPNSGLGLGSGLGGGGMSGNLGGGSLGGNMGHQGAMSNLGMGMGPGMGLGSGAGAGMNLQMSGQSNLDGMGHSRPGVTGFGNGPSGYGGGSMPLSGRAGGDNPASAGLGRVGMAGGVMRSDTIIIRNLPLDCNWQVRLETEDDFFM